ncbi:Bbp19 family protein [Acinetobacter soli]|uniref:Bbp19 family protein n=1 Tax=Acinetobacter soli TaxID=487316 RepID=UPI004056AACF
MINLDILNVVLLLILALVLFIYKKKNQKELTQWKEKYWDEARLHLDTRTELEGKWHTALEDISKLEAKRFEQWERAEVLEQIVIDLKQELSERPLPKADPEQPEEQGTFVRTRRVKRATPETYRIVFDLDVNGQRVLEHLTQVFCKDAFVPNDKGGERETCYRLGSQGVINFIVNNINTANNPNYEEQDNG